MANSGSPVVNQRRFAGVFVALFGCESHTPPQVIQRPHNTAVLLNANDASAADNQRCQRENKIKTGLAIFVGLLLRRANVSRGLRRQLRNSAEDQIELRINIGMVFIILSIQHSRL